MEIFVTIQGGLVMDISSCATVACSIGGMDRARRRYIFQDQEIKGATKWSVPEVMSMGFSLLPTPSKNQKTLDRLNQLCKEFERTHRGVENRDNLQMNDYSKSNNKKETGGYSTPSSSCVIPTDEMEGYVLDIHLEETEDNKKGYDDDENDAGKRRRRRLSS